MVGSTGLVVHFWTQPSPPVLTVIGIKVAPDELKVRVVPSKVRFSLPVNVMVMPSELLAKTLPLLSNVTFHFSLAGGDTLAPETGVLESRRFGVRELLLT